MIVFTGMGPTTIETDEDLVLSAQRGNRAAFESTVRARARSVFGRLYLETGDAHLAEDLLQETLLRAFHGLGQLQQPATLRAWLLRIAQNVLTDSARREARHKRSAPPRSRIEALATVPCRDSSPEEEATRSEESASRCWPSCGRCRTNIANR